MEFLPPDDRMKNDVPPVFKRRSSSFKWVVLSMIGAILIFFGSVWVTTASWTPPPSSKDFSNVQDYMKALNHSLYLIFQLMLELMRRMHL